MNYNSDFANRLKEERKRLGFTQTEIAKKCGISARMWIKYEQGLSMPGGEVLMALARQEFNLPYLFTESVIRMKDESKLPVGIAIEELELLVLFRQANDLGRAVIMSAARGAEKKESK